jgi:RNA polymerase sigma-70 factor, ECF subfamily
MSSRSRASLALVVSQNHRERSDADLARGLIAGEAWAVDVAWYRFAPMVLSTAERVLGSKSEAEDVAQEVFTRLFRTVKSLRDPESLRSFVYSVAIRALKSELRYRRVRAWLSFHEPDSLVDLPRATLDIESRDLLRKFYTLLDRLSPRDRLVFVMRRVESMTVEEIASAMDLSVSTVKRSMLHASSRLSRWVDSDPHLSHLWDARSMAR